MAISDSSTLSLMTAASKVGSSRGMTSSMQLSDTAVVVNLGEPMSDNIPRVAFVTVGYIVCVGVPLPCEAAVWMDGLLREQSKLPQLHVWIHTNGRAHTEIELLKPK